MKYIHFTVGLRPAYEVLGMDEIYSFYRGLTPTLRGFGGWMKYIHFTVGLRPPYEMLGRCDEIYSFDRGLMPTLRGFWVMR